RPQRVFTLAKLGERVDAHLVRLRCVLIVGLEVRGLDGRARHHGAVRVGDGSGDAGVGGLGERGARGAQENQHHCETWLHDYPPGVIHYTRVGCGGGDFAGAGGRAKTKARGKLQKAKGKNQGRRYCLKTLQLGNGCGSWRLRAEYLIDAKGREVTETLSPLRATLRDAAPSSGHK